MIPSDLIQGIAILIGMSAFGIGLKSKAASRRTHEREAPSGHMKQGGVSGLTTPHERQMSLNGSGLIAV
jgi:hypothetical protein